MHITIDEKIECSKCGSRSYETFQQGSVRGTRCLRCGHEKRERDPATQHDAAGVEWRKEPNRLTKF